MSTTYPLNGITYNAEDAQLYLCTRTSGVFSAEEDFAVSISDDTQLTIGQGVAWVHPSRFTGVVVGFQEAVTVDLPMADGSLPRIDRVVLRYDKIAAETYITVLTGTAASSPTAPAITRTELVYDLALVDVARPAGSTSISTSDLTSLILDEELCGVMRDGVTGIPTAQLLAEVAQRIDTELANLGLAHDFVQSAANSAAAAQQARQEAEQIVAADPTLTVAGAPADAEATGEAIAAARSTVYTITVPAATWSFSSGSSPYRNHIFINGISSDTVLSDITLAPASVGNSAAEAAAQTWSYLDTGAGMVTFYSDTKPTADFTIIAREVR